MMRSRSQFVVLAALISITLFSERSDAQEPESSGEEASAVIHAVLDSLFRTEGESPNTVLLYDSLVRPETLTRVNGHLVIANKSPIDSTTLADFMARALPFIPYGQRDIPAASYPRGFNYPRAIFVSARWMEALRRASTVKVTNHETDSSWAAAALQYPGAWGMTTLSVPGFNTDTTDALIWVLHRCGFDCYSDELVRLTRRAGVWRIAERIKNRMRDRLAPGSLRYLGQDTHRLRDIRTAEKERADSIARNRMPRVFRAQVLNSVTRGPISFARVMIVKFRNHEADTSQHFITDANGTFALKNLALGGITVVVRCPAPFNPGDLAGSGFWVSPGQDTSVTIIAHGISPCWKLRAHTIESGELSSPRYATAPNPSDSELVVYDAVLRDSAVDVSRAKSVVFARTQTRCGAECDPDTLVGLFPPGTLDPFLARRFWESDHWKPLNTERMNSIGLSMLGVDERKYMDDEGFRMEEANIAPRGEGFWRMFEASHPGVERILTFSSVAFNQAGDRALVELEDESRNDIEVKWLLLAHTGSRWRVIARSAL